MTPPLQIDALDAAPVAAPAAVGAPAFAAAAVGSALAHAGLLIALMFQAAPTAPDVGETVIDVAVIVRGPAEAEDVRPAAVAPAAPATDAASPASAGEPVAASRRDDSRDDGLSMQPTVEAAAAEPQDSPPDINEARHASLGLAITSSAPDEPRKAPDAISPPADASVAAESQVPPADMGDAPAALRAEVAPSIDHNAPVEPPEAPPALAPQAERRAARTAPTPRPEAPPRATSAKRPAPPRLAAPPANPRPPAPRAEPAPVRQAALTPAPRAGATASDAAPRGVDIAAYRSLVAARIAAAKRYPAGARERGESGRPILTFTLTPSGAVAGATIARSSGHADLDAETLAMLRRAAPFPKPPAGAPRSFSIGVSFDLR